MINRRIRKTYTISQDNIVALKKICERYKISESEAVNQIVANYAAENGLSARPRNEGGIFQTKKEVPSMPQSSSQDIAPSIDTPAPVLTDERFTYDDILEIKLQLHKIKSLCSMLDDKTTVMLSADNSLLHYLNPNTEYFSAEKQPHSYITEGKAEVAENKRKSQINAATGKK